MSEKAGPPEEPRRAKPVHAWPLLAVGVLMVAALVAMLPLSLRRVSGTDDCKGRSGPAAIGGAYSLALPVSRDVSGATTTATVDFDRRLWRVVGNDQMQSVAGTSAQVAPGADVSGQISLINPAQAVFEASSVYLSFLTEKRTDGCSTAALVVAGRRIGSGAGVPSTTPTRPESVAMQKVVHAANTTLASKSASVVLKFSDGRTLGLAAGPGSGTGSFDFPAAEGALNFSAEVVFAGPRLYVQRSQTQSNPAGQKPWVFIDLSAATDSLGTNLPQFVVQAVSLNPLLAVEQLVWGGTAAVATAGMPDTYTVTVDLRRALAAVAGPDQKPFAAALASEISAGGQDTTIGIQVTLDGSGRLSELRFTPPGAGADSYTLSLSHYGTSVHVSLPSPDNMTDLTSLLPSAERENNGGGDGDGS